MCQRCSLLLQNQHAHHHHNSCSDSSHFEPLMAHNNLKVSVGAVTTALGLLCNWPARQPQRYFSVWASPKLVQLLTDTGPCDAEQHSDRRALLSVPLYSQATCVEADQC